MSYGEHPVPIDYFGRVERQFTEFMHYLYLPVRMKGGSYLDVRLPERLEFVRPLVTAALADATQAPWVEDPYVYVTARQGYATPDNPINRPGWHCDGFGTNDLNYVWWNRWPTRFWIGEPDVPITTDHQLSVEQFEYLAARYPEHIVDASRDEVLYRLTPHVIHTTPVVPARGGMRQFIKVSVSNHRYNLKGNSRNYLFDYDWPMFDRDVARNDPHYAGGDFYEPKS